MGKVISSASMSLDGFIAKADNTIGRLFDWYDSGPVEMRTAMPDLTFHLTRQSADYLTQVTDRLGSLVVGRTLFDFTDGWGGRHPWDCPVVLLTHRPPQTWVEQHPDAPYHVVTTGIADAIALAKELAGDDKDVAATAGTIALQALQAGLLDEVGIDLVPVVMGEGRRYFGSLGVEDIPLGDPTVCIQGDRVTHLVFPVERPVERPVEHAVG